LVDLDSISAFNPFSLPSLMGSAAWGEAFKSAAPCLQGTGRSKRFADSVDSYIFADSKASPGTPPLPPTLPAEILFSQLRLIFPDCFHFFGPPKIHQKSDLYQTLPKPQKSDPWTPKARFWSHVGCLLASLLRSFFLSFLKMRKLCFWTTV
jgi:hypothetical protein